MQFEYRLSLSDYREANGAHAKKMWAWVGIVVVVLMIISVIPLVISRASLTEVINVLLPNFVLLAIFLTLGLLLNDFLVKRAWKSLKNLHGSIMVEVSEQGLFIRTPTAESTINWQFYIQFRETPNLFMVYQSNMIFHLFPKRAFATEEDMNQFRAFLQQNVEQ